MKNIFVENLREGSRADDVFLVASKAVLNTRDGKPFLKLRLSDRTGHLDAVKWGATEPEIASFGENDYIRVSGAVRTYNGGLQLTVESLRRSDQTVDPADFVKCSSQDPDMMMRELTGLLRDVADSHLSKLLARFLEDEDFVRRFRSAPAAKSIHHACVGGLLEHTLNVTRACAAIAGLYPHVDRGLLVTGAFLHDIGKTEEYAWSGSIDFTEAGHLVGHVVGGAMMVKAAADSIDGFDPILSLVLQHMILAHHGTREFGSPKQPKSIEAMILHLADDLDAKVAVFEEAIRQSDGSGEEGLFTKKHFLLERPLFKGMRAQDVPARDQAQPRTDDAADLDLFAVNPRRDPFADD